jgi:perosamine synthetase
MMISLFKPTLKRKDMDSVLSCMVSDRLSPGLYAQEFVHELSQKVKAGGGAVLAGYYQAVKLAFDLLELQSGDGVVISPLAPAVYLAVMSAKGLLPIFVDVDLSSGLISPEAFSKTLESSPRAVVLHHTLGLTFDTAPFIASGVKVIEDISQALGAQWGDIPAGGSGAVTIASLSEENIITAGGGALVLVRKRSDAQSLKRLLDNNPDYTLLPDLNAAVALAQVRELSAFLGARNEIGKIFDDALQRSRHPSLVQPEGGSHVRFSYPVVVETSLKDVRQFAKKKGVDTRAAFSESIIAMDDKVYNAFPNAKSLLLRCVLFPLYPMLGRSNVETIARVLAVLP